MKYNKVIGSVNIRLDTKRIDDNMRRAQNLLDQRVLKDMIPYIPASQQEAMRGATHIIEPGLISTNTPYAHYQYTGELYLTEDGRSWADKWEKKFPTGTPLKYHTEGTGDHWFERAKNEHKEQWVYLVKKEVGKG